MTDPSVLERAPHWDAPELFPASEPPRTAEFRRLQSWYRQTILGVEPGAHGKYAHLGSYLSRPDVEANPWLNFLTPGALAHAQERAVAVQAEGGTLERGRLFHNMLSSTPLCFNMFGALRSEPSFIELFRELFDAEAVRIMDVVCEWAPRPKAEFLNDRTAFDAVVFYDTADGERFMAIETKYTEPFSAKEYLCDEYVRMTQESGWFADAPDTVDLLKGRKSNQLWRNVLLAAALEREGSQGEGRVAVVSCQNDPGAEAALSIVGSRLNDPSKLRQVTFEQVVEVAREIPSLSTWALRFIQRYLDIAPVHGIPPLVEIPDPYDPWDPPIQTGYTGSEPMAIRERKLLAAAVIARHPDLHTQRGWYPTGDPVVEIVRGPRSEGIAILGPSGVFTPQHQRVMSWTVAFDSPRGLDAWVNEFERRTGLVR